MHEGLPLIIVDDDQAVCELTAEYVHKFYVWGDVVVFSDPGEAFQFCNTWQTGVAVFILDVFLGQWTGFSFIEAIMPKFPFAPQDTIIMTGNAGVEVVDTCIAYDIHYLLEKPIRPYALQLAVRGIVSKYLKFARTLLSDPLLARQVTGMSSHQFPN